MLFTGMLPFLALAIFFKYPESHQLSIKKWTTSFATGQSDRGIFSIKFYFPK